MATENATHDSIYPYPYPNYYYPNYYTYPYHYIAPTCEHCYCAKSDNDFTSYTRKGKHLQCCKCGNIMAEKFVRTYNEDN